MRFSIKTAEITAGLKIDVPASKSISNRLLILNALSYSLYPVKNLSNSDDTRILMSVLNSNSSYFDVGAAGTSMRFLTAYLSKIVGEWTVTGSERMKQRPVRILVDALNQLGGRVEYIENEGFPPLRIFGSALTGGKIELCGDVSSQYISALLMIAPYMKDGLHLHLKGEITSAPYIRLTLALMNDFGVTGIWKGNEIHVPSGEYKAIPAKVEGDWSAASYWYQTVAFSPDRTGIHLKGLERNSHQGDAVVAKLFTQLGVQSKFLQGSDLYLEKVGDEVKCFQHNFTDTPDLAQTFAVTCAFLNIPFHLTGLHTLKIKETDRINALITELKRFGFVTKSNGSDDILWDGEKTVAESAPVINTYNDHRMAMAFAPAALKTASLAINNPMVVTKSYPKFWDDLKKAGFVLSVDGGEC
ncbi:MAG: 3-phosphoshikimate 1-carboxyvinyltransferase [Cytophagaceae bacterium]|jgi:3-phosphoshikimate 1-carboxyvinyltransferase|nr:3-phosphoshikimate 1-carboxyvinyltransferase [Cytophagaceae bacterium]